ncbi:FISUMP domain-containing protein [uncultured Fibrobacter sp.]|uniref:FISUMP domain-containing protein n=1 Tax=uncultured Fibrobacter sp. TaxID=261512 RepID=UPI0025D4227A|nr:FISUMP domain-containing protein [uncultured Fibrobacter sp.]
MYDERDGKTYKTVKIGEQEWMAENLNYLPKDTAGTFWAGRSVCGGGEYKSLQEGDCSIYGRLYESDFTTNEKKKQAICPDGWELPTKRLYETMISYLGENPIEKIVLKDIVLWPDIEEATNESGFSALPSGYYNRLFGYNEMESEGIQVASFAIARSNGTDQNQIGIVSGLGRIWYSTFQDGYYMAIRCIKD